MPSTDFVSLPKVVLHDHLDGGLRVETVLDLAAQTRYSSLPSEDLEELRSWFFQGQSSSLERYLEAFVHTVGVMQTAEAVERVAYEAVEDLAADGVVYAEIRMAPTLCTEAGLSHQEVIEAVIAGLRRGEAEFGMPARMIVDAMRQEGDSLEVAQAAIEYAGRGVVGFDLAGPEASFPCTDHAAACRLALEGGLGLTIHAGEGDGVDSIAAALEVGAQRIGHGARLIEDLVVEDGEVASMGPVATEVHERRLVLELCPTSNLHTGMYPSAGAHPLGVLYRAGFAATINTDNRLMSQISPSDEFALAVDHLGFDRDDLKTVTLRAVEAAFCDEETKAAVRERVVAGYS